MRIAELNALTGGSTGKIMLNIANVARSHGHTAKTYVPMRHIKGITYADLPDHYYWSTPREAWFHYYVGALLGQNGTFTYNGTRKLINDLKNFHPDIIHLHTLHMFCINFPMFFDYIKENKIKVVWTLHDCWSFTGHCPHFIMAGCDKWRTGCHHCPQPRIYPKMYLDTSKTMYKKKKKWFCGVENMTIVTPSEWLAGLVKESYLKDYPVKVINNGIDLGIFKPVENDFRAKYACENKKLLLGVADSWDLRKGIDVFIELSKRLPENYKIVLVGTNDEVDTQLPDNIISIHRTENQSELIKIYTAADLFVNPTREDTYPTVNMEALACGTPVLTFKTGGSPESIDETCGSVVDVNDIDAMEKEIIRICTENPFSSSACIDRSKNFDMQSKFEKYIELYNEVTAE